MKSTAYLRSLATAANAPKWVRPLDETAARLTIRRYQNRMNATQHRQRAETWYQRYLLSPHWFGFRMIVFVLCGGKCCRCGDVADHVHHRTYCRLGRERLEDVEPLCAECHKAEHDGRNES